MERMSEWLPDEDPDVANLKRVVEGRISGKGVDEVLYGAMNRIDDLRAEVKRLREWVNDLQSGMYINCVYCGHRYGPDSEVPASMADVLKEHVEQCPEHPMSALKKEVERLRGADALAYRIVNKLRGDNNGLTPDWLVDMGGQDHHSKVGKLHEAAEALLDDIDEFSGKLRNLPADSGPFAALFGYDKVAKLVLDRVADELDAILRERNK